MHIPDGFLDLATCATTGACSVAIVGLAVHRSKLELDERSAPLTGLTAAFIFAAQMLNFPVAAGTSGHLIGGALAAVLIGPWTGILCLTVVLLVQCFMFTDGGMTALGANVWNMGIVAVVVSYLVMRLMLRVLPKRTSSVPIAAAIGAFVSVVAGAASFCFLFAVGGTVNVPLGAVVTSMLGVHVLIGIGEALITGLVVAAVLALRPDLVAAARPYTHIEPPKVRIDPEVVA